MMRKIYKTDKNQQQIIDALRDCGVSVVNTAMVGNGFPDICVGFQKKTYLFEIKRDKKYILTPAEIEFMRIWKGQMNIITNLDDVMKVIF